MNKKFNIVIVFALCMSSLSFGQSVDNDQIDSLRRSIRDLQKKVTILEKKSDENELKNLLDEAETFQSDQSIKDKEKVFKSGQRSLQAINPELSVTGDLYGLGVLNSRGFSSAGRNGAYFRVLGFHFQSNLDPYSLAKATVELNPEGIELGEAYATWFNLIKNVSLTAGKFRQQFGVVNRWHEHGLDQFDYPLALSTILGEEGLNQTGLGIEWLMPPLWADANSLNMEITNGENERLFSGEIFSFPTILLHLRNYYDLNQNTYLELGLSGMTGKNNVHGYEENGNILAETSRSTYLGGLDLTLMWEPLDQTHYHSLTFRSELYYAHKEIQMNQLIKAWGAYASIEYQFNERLYAGLRYDYTQPFIEHNSGRYIDQIVPYITWWQSHWVRMRLQYNYLNGNLFRAGQSSLRIQLTWAMGPHKHERY